ncbi:hypothetical protein C8Q75DRAFT_33929 [Abortiporus biennis]|nr:hypothetical protein C8Q75DRAFT_33929 [Abortiporus biennis]
MFPHDVSSRVKILIFFIFCLPVCFSFLHLRSCHYDHPPLYNTPLPEVDYGSPHCSALKTTLPHLCPSSYYSLTIFVFYCFSDPTTLPIHIS